MGVLLFYPIMKKIEAVLFKDLADHFAFAFQDIYNDPIIFQVLWQKTGVSEAREIYVHGERLLNIDPECKVWPIDISGNPGRIEGFPGIIILT